MATGLQKRFDWAGVATAGIMGGVSAEVSGRMAAAASAGQKGLFAQSLNSFGSAMVSGTAGAIAGAAARSVVTGTDFGSNLKSILPDVIGSTIGNMIAGGVQARQQAKSASDYKSDLGEVRLSSGRKTAFGNYSYDDFALDPSLGSTIGGGAAGSYGFLQGGSGGDYLSGGGGSYSTRGGGQISGGGLYGGSGTLDGMDVSWSGAAQSGNWVDEVVVTARPKSELSLWGLAKKYVINPTINFLSEAGNYIAVGQMNEAYAQQQSAQATLGFFRANSTRIGGGVQFVAGTAEALAGAAVATGGAATSEFGVGIPVAVAGGAMVFNGYDNATAGWRALTTGRPQSTVLATGLRAAGVPERYVPATELGVNLFSPVAAAKLPGALSATGEMLGPQASRFWASEAGSGPNPFGGLNATSGASLDWSRASLRVGADAAEHVTLNHGSLSLTKPTQGVFYGNPVSAVEDAWGIAKQNGVSPVTVGNRDFYIVPRANSGYAGGMGGQLQNMDHVTIITEAGTSRVVTAYPSGGTPPIPRGYDWLLGK